MGKEEKVLNVLADLVLVFGLIAALGLSFFNDFELKWIIISASILFGSIVQCYFLYVICNISNKLK